MPRVGIRCSVNGDLVDDAECLRCKVAGCDRVATPCPWTYEMLRGMMDGSGRATAHISATMLTGMCPRRTWLEQHEDYHVSPLRVFPAWRGGMGHQMTESHPEPGCIYEQRFETEVILPNGRTVLVTGALDKLAPHHSHIEDFKTKTEKKLLQLTRPQEDHVWQLNIYRWLVMVGWPQQKVDKDRYGDPLPGGLVLKPKVPAEIEVDSLRLVYWAMGNPDEETAPVRPFPVKLIDLEEVERYVIDRATALLSGCPPIPPRLDPYRSIICRDWCAVRDHCITRDVGF